MHRVSSEAEMAKWLCLPGVSSAGNMEDTQGIVSLRQMSDTDVGDVWNHLARNSETSANVVSCDVAYNKPKIWCECSWIDAPFGFGKLSHGTAWQWLHKLRRAMVRPSVMSHLKCYITCGILTSKKGGEICQRLSTGCR